MNLPGFPDVRVYLDNREAGRTDSDGRLLLPGLRPYESNRVRVAVDDLPLDAEIGAAEVEAVPFERSGMTIAFPLAHAEQATAVLARPGRAAAARRPAAAQRRRRRHRLGGARRLQPGQGPLRAATRVASEPGEAAYAASCRQPVPTSCCRIWAPSHVADRPVGLGPAMRRRRRGAGARRVQCRCRPGGIRGHRPAAAEPGYGRGRGPLRYGDEFHGRHLARRRLAATVGACTDHPAAGSTTRCSPIRATRCPGATAPPSAIRSPPRPTAVRPTGSPIYGIVPPQTGIDAGEYDDSLK